MGAARLVFVPILVCGTLSDIFDGVLARRFGVKITFGRVVEPILRQAEFGGHPFCGRAQLPARMEDGADVFSGFARLENEAHDGPSA